MDWAPVENPLRSKNRTKFISGDLYEKMLIFKTQFKNVGFVNIDASRRASSAAAANS